jgi:serine O-acetyltransferase
VLKKIVADAIEMTRACGLPINAHSIARTVFLTDSFPVMVMARVRESARRFHIPGVNRTLRYVQMAVYGVEIGRDVSLGPGVYFVHTLGTVVGGNAKVGARVRFMGSNTVGTLKDDGHPVIEDDVQVGCGARILGNIRIGAGARIGANAVVISDVPAGAVAVGVPAVCRVPEVTSNVEPANTNADANGKGKVRAG